MPTTATASAHGASPSVDRDAVLRGGVELLGRALLVALFLLSGIGKILMLAANGAGRFSLDARSAG